MEIDARHARQGGQAVEIRDRRRAAPLGGDLHRRVRVAETTPAERIAVAVVAEEQPGARADLDQVERRVDLTPDRREAEAQRQRSFHHVGLYQSCLDDRDEVGRECGTEVDQCRTGSGGRQRGVAHDRRVEPGEFVVGPREEEGVDRSEEEECRILAGTTLCRQP